MRELKFRAWVNETMLYFDNPKTGIQYRCGEIELSIGWDEYKQPKYYEPDEYNPEPRPEFEIMQYTGLKDSNGVEIYDGDVLKCISKNAFSEGMISFRSVIWGQCAWWVEKTMFNLAEYMDYGIVTVHGNIHENPELIN